MKHLTPSFAQAPSLPQKPSVALAGIAATAAWLLLTSCTDLPSSPRSFERSRLSLPAPDQPPDAIVLASAEDPLARAAAPSRPVPPPRPLQIQLARCPTAGCELDLYFSHPMVAEPVPGDESPAPDRPHVVFHPPQKGSFRWLSPTVLRFTPEPGSLSWGQRVEVTIAEAAAADGTPLRSTFTRSVQVPFFRAAGKVASWPVVAGEPRFVALLNWSSGSIGRGPLFLLYDQPVDVAQIASGLTVTDAEGMELDVHLARPQDADQVTRDASLDPALLVALTLEELPADGEQVTLSLPRQPVRAPEALWTQELVVRTELRVLGQGPPHRGRDQPLPTYVPLQTTWEFELNAPFDIGRFEEALRLTPEPLDAHVSAYYTRHARVHLTLEPGTRYRISLDPAFTDVLGNRLGEELAVVLRSEDLPPLVELPRLPTIVERGEYGRLALRARNVEQARFVVHPFGSPEDFAHALTSRRGQRCSTYGAGSARATELPVFDGDEATGGPPRLNVTETRAAPIDLEPGLYCVELHALGRGSEARGEVIDTVLVQSSDLGLTAKAMDDSIFVWATRLSDARAQGEARITVLSASGTALGHAVTDEQGIARVAVADLLDQAADDPVFVVAEKAEEEAVDVAVLRVDAERLSHARQFALKGTSDGPRPLYAAVFTERGVYRPGETVHVKLIVPDDADAGTAAAPRSAAVEIHDPRGQQVIRRDLELDAFGGGDLDLELKDQAPVGVYVVRAKLGERLTHRRFRVEEYRVPSFRVTVEGPESWKRGSEVRAVVAADYLHGGTLDGRPIKWKVLREAQAFAPAAFPGYVFSVDGESRALAGMLSQGHGRLDGQGRSAVVFRPDHPPSAGPMLYVIEATVTDVDRQAYAGRALRLVHPAAFYVGVLAPSRRVLDRGGELSVPVLAVRPDGTPLPGVEVRLRLERIDHHTSARLGGAEVVQLNRPVPAPVEECVVATEEKAASCRFALERAGRYRVRAWAQDREHQVVQTGFDLTVAGDDPTAWPRFDQDRIEVVADRPSYRPGDVARLVVETPFERARGLLTVERGGVLEHRLFEIDRDTPALELEITEEHAPNVYASVVLLRGREHRLADATGFETGAPSFKLGYARLEVEPTSRRLDVSVDAPRLAQPGGVLPVKIAVRDHRGRPGAGQATVMVVDEAVLGMTGYRTPDPVAEIHADRALGVRTAESRLELTHAKRSRRERLFPSGDGGDGALLTDFPEELRSNFQSTAYWNPDVPVGEDGIATLDVELPDNTTTYRVMAVVADRQGRSGSADGKVVVKKPLMVRAVVPRFVYPGDRLRLEAQVWNGTTADGEVDLAAELDGLAWAGDETLGRRPSRTVPSGGSRSFPFLVDVTGRESSRIVFSVRMGEYTDAVEVELPVLSPGTRRTRVASKTVSAGGSVSVELPAERLAGTARLEVVASTTALSELKDAVGYLMRYPNGCIEQTTSTAYPLVVLGDLLPEIGVTVDKAQLAEYSAAGVRRILSFQTSEGGLSYWPGGSEPHAFATAFGLTALIEGKKRGYDVPEDALAGMADYLEAALRRGDVTERIPHGGMADGDTRAFFVMTLGRLGRPQAAYLAALWRQRASLSAFGLSFLAIAAAETGEVSLLEPILEEVREAATEEAQEAWFEGAPKGGWSFDSPLRTHASALLAYARAPGVGDSGMGAKLLKGLLQRRRGGMWGNTQENVFGIMAVHAISGGGPGGLGGGDAPRMELVVGGRAVSEDQLEKPSDRVRRLSLTEDDLDLEEGRSRRLEATLRHRGGPPVILTVRTQYEVPLSEENRRARSNGFEIRRDYETLDGEPLEGSIPLGSLVRVRLRVKSSEKQNYVAVADKLPAGLEALNTHLETTEKVSQAETTPVIERSLELLSYQEIRDSRVAFFVDDMPAGEYEYSYVARATTPGTFLRPAADVEAMYLPQVSGSTKIDEVTIAEVGR